MMKFISLIFICVVVLPLTCLWVIGDVIANLIRLALITSIVTAKAICIHIDFHKEYRESLTECLHKDIKTVKDILKELELEEYDWTKD